MDPSLAARTSTTTEPIHQTQNPRFLHQTTCTSSTNPLHTVCESGNLASVRQLLESKPQFSQDLNPEGYSPLHLASANGYVEIVRELLTLDPKLCRLEGKGGATPLHIAAIKGKADVIIEMISCCTDSVADVTIQKETPLLLAVRNSQFQSTRVMVEWIVENNKEEVFNMKDEQGNNVLHLATWKKQRQVLELLLGNGLGISNKLEVNGINRHGLTPLDLLQLFPSEAGDREIQEILQNAGALRAQDIILPVLVEISATTPEHHHEPNSTTNCNTRLRLPKVVEYFKYQKGRDSPGHVRDALLIIAVLVATATYQVGISPPGGLWQDNSEAKSADTPLAGKSILGTYSSATFAAFAVFNSIGLCVSLAMIRILTGNFPLRLELTLCMAALWITYNISLGSIAPDKITKFITVITAILPFLGPVIFIYLRNIVQSFAKLVLAKVSRR